MFKKIKSFFSSEPEIPPMITITLEELAQRIWLKHNADYEPVPLDDDPATVEEGVPDITQPDMQATSQSVAADAQTPAAPPSPATLPAKAQVATEQKQMPVKAPSVPVKEGNTTRFESNVIYQDIIEPYKNLYVGQDALTGVCKILELLDKHGNCPSIVTTGANKDSEIDDIYSIKQILLKVTLKEHSFRVAKIAVKLLKEQYRDYENLVPKTVTAALGHDLGKIPAFREIGIYSKTDHPLISASKVAELFDGKDIFWLNSVLEAIKNHHKHSDEQFSNLIRQADSKAREMEVAEVSKDLSIKPWEEWFDVERVLGMVLPHINIIQTGNMWQAFSFGSTVYCQPDFIYDLTRKLATESKVIDLTITSISEKEVALRKVVNSLRQKELLSCDIGEGYYGRNFDITLDKFKKKFYLIPIKIEAFGVPAQQINIVREGHLQLIKEVSISKR